MSSDPNLEASVFANLIESAPRRERRLAQGILSFCFHLAVGVGAVEASRRVVAPAPDGPRVDTTIFVLPARAPVEPVRVSAPLPGPTGPIDPIVVSVPVIDPIGIPPAEAGPAIDPRRFSLAPVAPSCGNCASEAAPATTVFTEASVDEPVGIVRQAVPEFPPLLKAAAVTGTATIEFVVDTLGRAEPASIRVVEATHPAFGASAGSAIALGRFRPARVKGIPVRQLVRQVVRFRID